MKKVREKIMIIGPTPPPIHGVAVSTERLLDSSLRDRFGLVHLDTSDRRNHDNIGKLDLRNVYIAMKNVLQMIALCLSESPAVVCIPISQNSLAYLRDGLLIIAGRLSSNARIVIHLHGSYFRTFYDEANFLVKLFVDLTMRCCDQAIVLGHCLKWIFDKWFDERDIEVAPNGTDMNPDIRDKFAPRLNRGANGESVVLVHLGNLFPAKGTYELVRAFKLVTEKHPCAKLRIAGEWDNKFSEYRTNILKFMQDNDLHRKIDFNGVITGMEKEKFLVNADLFVLPSRNEGHPTVIIEAMSAANPVVATRVGAVPETVIEGRTGFLVEKQNPQALADAIIKLIENPELRMKMGKAGRRRYERFYTKEKNIESIARIFERVLER